MRTSVALESVAAWPNCGTRTPLPFSGPTCSTKAENACWVSASFCRMQHKPGSCARATNRAGRYGEFIRRVCSKPFARHQSQMPSSRICCDDRPARRSDHDARPLCVPADDGRFRFAPARRREALESYEKLGAQLRTVDGVSGVNFAVWAPNAEGVGVVGDFNVWDGRRHPMRKHVPGRRLGTVRSGHWSGHDYKFRVKSRLGQVVDKSDPYGFFAEVPPRTAIHSVTDLAQLPVATTKHAWPTGVNPTRLDKPDHDLRSPPR